MSVKDKFEIRLEIERSMTEIDFGTLYQPRTVSCTSPAQS